MKYSQINRFQMYHLRSIKYSQNINYFEYTNQEEKCFRIFVIYNLVILENIIFSNEFEAYKQYLHGLSYEKLVNKIRKFHHPILKKKPTFTKWKRLKIYFKYLSNIYKAPCNILLCTVYFYLLLCTDATAMGLNVPETNKVLMYYNSVFSRKN